MLLRLMLAVPILLMPNLLYVPLDTGVPGLNLANLLLIGILVAVALSAPRTAPMTGVGMLTPPLLLLFLALAIATLIAMVAMPMDPLRDLIELKDFVFYPLLYFLYRRCRQDLAGTRQLIWLTVAVAVAAGIDAVLQGIEMDTLSSFSDTNRVAGPFGDYRSANRAGVFFVMFLPMLAAAALFLRSRGFMRLLAASGAAILALAILLTYSRQAYLIAVVVLALLVVRKNVLLAMLLAVAAIPALALLPAGVMERVAETRQENVVGGPELDVSTASRFEIWSGAMDMWTDHPAGVGLGRFPEYIGDYSQYQNYDAHNMYVLMLAECGPLGLLALLWLLWRLLRLGFNVSRSSGDAESRVLGIGFTATVVAMAMGNLYGSPFHEGLVMADFWILCGLIERYNVLKRQIAVQPVDDTSLLSSIYERFPLAEHISPGRYREELR
ncbi:MAG: O-antigen ligase family protein [Lysobacter sp.]